MFSSQEIDSARVKALYRLPHRYRSWRRFLDVFVAALLVLAPPLLGWIRFDFWRGQHVYMGETVTIVEALKGFIAPFFVINALILIVNHQFGRFLCGWVCPTGVVNRWSEELAWRFRKQPLVYHAILIVIALIMSTGGMLWFVDLRVYLEGSAQAKALTGLSHFVLAGAVFFEIHVLRWGFCRKLCPSGVYFAILGQKSQTGIALKDPETGGGCTDCGLCDRICPMGLEPRQLMEEPRESEGLYFKDMSNLSLCIRCGDCITACDTVFSKQGGDGVLQMGFDPSFEV